MEESGQTDAERRRLRAQQRELQKQMLAKKGDAMVDPETGVLEQVQEENNVLWDQVRFAREAVLDGENLKLISSSAAKQLDRLMEVPRYDALKLCSKLREKCKDRDRSFNWKSLGQAAGACFNSVPTNVVSFLNGPMDAEYTPKVRKKPERRKPVEEEEDEEEISRQEKNEPSASDKLSAVEKHMVAIDQILKKRCRSELKRKVEAMESELKEMKPEEKKKTISKLQRKADICAIQYLFNPRSFTQTVENIFNFSFLIKKGSARISVRQDEKNDQDDEESGKTRKGTRPVVTHMMMKKNVVQPKQAIVSLDMQDWKDLCQSFNVRKGDIPHRTGSRHAPPASSLSQSSAPADI